MIVRRWPLFAGACLVASLLVAASSPAKANLVLNGGFEQTSLATTGSVCAQNGSTVCASRVADWNSVCAAVHSPNCVPDNAIVYLVFPNNGLTVGDSYVVSFYQAASQQLGAKPSATTEQWQVSPGGEIKDLGVDDRCPGRLCAVGEADTVLHRHGRQRDFELPRSGNTLRRTPGGPAGWGDTECAGSGAGVVGADRDGVGRDDRSSTVPAEQSPALNYLTSIADSEL
jgi:hypothetical protein